MKIILKFLLLHFFIVVFGSQYAQVGIGTLAPDASSVLDLVSSSKGFLMPRLTLIQRNAIVSPAKGLMIFNLDTNNSEINTGTSGSPVWIGIKKDEAQTIYAISAESTLVISASEDFIASDLIVSPTIGSYLASFNAQLSGASETVTTFDSDGGVADLTNLYDELMAYPGGTNHALVFGSITGETLPPGVYDVGGAPSITGTLTLAGGTATANPVFIIRGPGAFTTGIGTTVILTGNAKPENIFWVSGAAMSTGASTIMKGTMLGGGVGAGAVSLGANTDLAGRLFTKLGAVTRGANDVISTPIGAAPVNLGLLSSFAMWSSSGGVSDVATATTIGDVGTAAGVLSITGTHTGAQYPAGTVGGDVTSASTSMYSIYVDGDEVTNSRRTVQLENSIISLQAMVTLVSDDLPVELRWKVNKGSATLTNRIFSLTRSE